MLCSEVQLISPGDSFVDVKPLPCNRWTCEYCQPRRRKRLLAIAASGEPNKFMTLTVSPNVGCSQLERRDMLHDAFTKLKKRVLRQFALAPERRWALKTRQRTARQEAIARAITAKTPQRGCDRLPYMAFLEATKAGEPHLHVLLRCPYIPQDWIAEQMAEMLGSPVCDIRQVGSTRRAVFYVTKYVAKAPAQFGTRKRYWMSRDWQVNQGDRPKRETKRDRVVSIRRRGQGGYVEIGDDPYRVVQHRADGWTRVWSREVSRAYIRLAEGLDCLSDEAECLDNAWVRATHPCELYGPARPRPPPLSWNKHNWSPVLPHEGRRLCQ